MKLNPDDFDSSKDFHESIALLRQENIMLGMASDRASKVLEIQSKGVDAFAQYLQAKKESNDTHFTPAQRRWKRAIRIVILRNSVKLVRKLLLKSSITTTSIPTPVVVAAPVASGKKLVESSSGGQLTLGRRPSTMQPTRPERKKSTSFTLLPPVDPRVVPKQKASREYRNSMGSRRDSKAVVSIDKSVSEIPFDKLQGEIHLALAQISESLEN